jgi:hypothetical protein
MVPTGYRHEPRNSRALLPFRPRTISEGAGRGEVIAILEREAAQFSVPGKVLTYGRRKTNSAAISGTAWQLALFCRVGSRRRPRFRRNFGGWRGG